MGHRENGITANKFFLRVAEGAGGSGSEVEDSTSQWRWNQCMHNESQGRMDLEIVGNKEFAPSGKKMGLGSRQKS